MDTESTQNATIIMIALQLSLYREKGQTTRDVYWLGEGGTPIVLSAKRFTSIARFLAAYGCLLVQGEGPRTTLTSNDGEDAIIAAIEALVSRVWLY
jgi:hypothetical protein